MTANNVFIKGGVLAFVLLGTATGCRFQARGTMDPPPPPPTATVQGSATVSVSGTPTTAQGVTVVEVQCTQGAPEQCNGLDDNCNGQIDEGCGYSSGNIQITASWTTRQDVDMYVTDPAGETISYSHTQSASGGTLDHDARGNCNPGTNDTIENVFWNSNPPSGTYQVELHYWGDCNTGSQPALTTVSISVGGRVIGAYQYSLAPQARIAVASFQI